MEIKQTIKTDNLIHKNGAFFARNMRKDSSGGVTPCSLVRSVYKQSGTISENLGLIKGSAKIKEQSSQNLSTTIWGKNEDGNLFVFSSLMYGSFQGMDYSQTQGNADGITVDSNNEIVYTGSQYMGTTIRTTLDGALAQAANTIDISDATGIPTSGYAIILNLSNPGDSRTETIQYTGVSTNQLTGVTRGKFNTTDQSHNDGDIIVFFDDNYQDFGSSNTKIKRPAYRWNDKVFLGNGNYVSEWDGTTLTTQKLNLPEGYEIVDFSELPTASGSLVLIIANYGNVGTIFLWDGSSEYWKRKIEVKETIQKAYKNYIATSRGIYQTDGYILKLVAELPDDIGKLSGDSFTVEDIKGYKEKYLLISNSLSGGLDRNIPGLWILDTTTGELSVLSSKRWGHYGVNYGTIIESSLFGWIYVANDYAGGALFLVSDGGAIRGSVYQTIYNPNTSKVLQLKQLSLNIDNTSFPLLTDYNFDIVVRYYDFQSPLYVYSQISEASSAKNEIVITDTLATPKVGDKIEIIERNYVSYENVCYAPRNIIAIEHTTGKYTLTLDEDLPEQIGATYGSSSPMVIIQPLKKAKKISVTGDKIDFKDFIIPIPTGSKFRKLLIEVEFRITSGGPRLNSIEVTSNVWRN